MARSVPSRRNRKSEIVATAARLLSDRGLGGVTTRAIAEAVPCSEGAIYVHFRDRIDLLLAVVATHLPAMLLPLHALQEKVGSATPEANLLAAVNGMATFQARILPMLCSLVVDPELQTRFRESMDAVGDRGPHRGLATLAAYIQAEQKLGRIAPEVDSKTAASTLMAVPFFHLFTENLFGSKAARFNARKLVALALARQAA